MKNRYLYVSPDANKLTVAPEERVIRPLSRTMYAPIVVLAETVNVDLLLIRNAADEYDDYGLITDSSVEDIDFGGIRA